MKRDLVPLFEVLAPELDEPAAEHEALLTVRVLDHAIERDVLWAAHHDLSHLGSPISVRLDCFELRSESALKSNVCVVARRESGSRLQRSDATGYRQTRDKAGASSVAFAIAGHGPVGGRMRASDPPAADACLWATAQVGGQRR